MESEYGILDAPKLGIEDVLAIQSLAMITLRNQARIAKRAERMHRFMIYDAIPAEEEYGSEMEECFLGVCVGRVAPRNWTMRVSFLKLDLSEKFLYSNTRELYRFDWNANGDCFGEKATYVHFGEITGRQFSSTGEIIDDVTFHKVRASNLIGVDECDELGERMLDVSKKRAA